MNLVVLALATSTVSPALSAPTPYGYGKPAVLDSRGLPNSDPEHESTESESDTRPPTDQISMGFVPDSSLPADERSMASVPGTLPPADGISMTSAAPLVKMDPGEIADPSANAYPPGSSATDSPAATAADRLPWWRNKRVLGGAAIGLFATAITGIVVTALTTNTNAGQNNTMRTSEALEGRANAELMERALGDHDLDE